MRGAWGRCGRRTDRDQRPHSRPVGPGPAIALACVIAGVGVAPAAAMGGRPGVTKMSVRAGSTGGGTRVRITGRNLGHVRWVEFGSTRARIVATPSSTAMVVTSPAHSAGTIDVRVRTAAGLSARVTADRYRYRRPPVQIQVGTSVGATFACARLPRTVRCWGANEYGELGNGTTTLSRSPVTVKGLSSGVRDISTGSSDACAVTATHAAKCWGWEFSGQLGNGVVDNGNGHVTTPVGVHGLSSGVRSIVAGDGSGNTCAVTTSGLVKCWGSDLAQQLGTNDTSGLVSAVPVTIGGLPSAVAVAVGESFACALTTTGAVYCWGSDGFGELGAGSAPGLESATPVQVHGLTSGVRSLSAGGSTACAVTSSRAVECWGSNSNGVLGDGQADTQTSSDVPVAVKTLGSGQATVTVGAYRTACATSTTGRVMCWGYNYDGTLGNGTQNDSAVPVQVKGLTHGGKEVAFATYTGCVLTTTGQVKCWGYVPLGDGQSNVPVTLPWYR